MFIGGNHRNIYQQCKESGLVLKAALQMLLFLVFNSYTLEYNPQVFE